MDYRPKMSNCYCHPGRAGVASRPPLHRRRCRSFRDLALDLAQQLRRLVWAEHATDRRRAGTSLAVARSSSWPSLNCAPYPALPHPTT